MVEAGLIVEGMRTCVVGDQAYLLRPWLQVALPSVPGIELGVEETSFNADVAVVCVAFEWGFKEIYQAFPALDFARKM